MSAELECRELIELVTDYLEGALAPGELVRFEAHLAACDGCTEYLRQVRATVSAAGRLTERSLPGDVRNLLLAAFRGWRSRGRPA